MSVIGAISSSTIAMAQADNFMKIAQTKMSMGKPEQPKFNQANDFKNTPIWNM
jgi:hypothetical protein